MTIRLYLDEDTSDADLLEALRIRGVDVVTAAGSGRGGSRHLAGARIGKGEMPRFLRASRGIAEMIGRREKS